MKKKIVLVLTAISLCAAMVFGGTLAFLTSQTDVLENIMKFDSGGEGSDSAVYIEIAEPHWDKDEYQWLDNKNAGIPAGNRKGQDGNPLWGVQQPYYDTNVIDKDPVIANNSNVKAYVGVEITLPKTILVPPRYKEEHSLTWSEFDRIAKLGFVTNLTERYNHEGKLNNQVTYLPTTPSLTPAENGWTLVRETNFDPNNWEDTASKRYYVYTKPLEEKGSQKNMQADRHTTTANSNITNRLFDVIAVPGDASQQKFDGNKKYPLTTPIVNPNFDTSKAASEENPRIIKETDNIFMVLRDNSYMDEKRPVTPYDPDAGSGSGSGSGSASIGVYPDWFDSALQINIRAYATQAEIQSDTVDATVAKWNDPSLDSGKLSKENGALFALDLAFPGVFQDPQNP